MNPFFFIATLVYKNSTDGKALEATSFATVV